jgi:predicted RNase H-like HicB family nuclease
MYSFLVVIEKVGRTFSAYVPDLPGCVATGKNRKTVETRIHEAIAFHIQGLREDSLPIPESVAIAEVVLVNA